MNIKPLTGNWKTKCTVCGTVYKNGVGSTPCCGALQSIIEPQTPEAATPRSDSAWNEATYEVENDPRSSWQAVAIRMCHEAQELERELQTVTAERDKWKSQHKDALNSNIVLQATNDHLRGLESLRGKVVTEQENATLRTALATAEAQERVFQANRDAYIARLRENLGLKVGDPLTESCANIRRQLTEAQAACAVKDEALRSCKNWNYSDGMLHHQSFDKKLVDVALQDNPGSDLLKRLADAEKEIGELKNGNQSLIDAAETLGNCADTVRRERDEAKAELSRLQAEVKEWKSIASDIYHSNPTMAEALIRYSNAARTQPKP